MYCYKCGAEIDNDAVICMKCGCATKNYNAKAVCQNEASSKSRLVALLLCVFLGYFGVHRFYVGKIGTGIIWFFTAGCFGIGWIIDIIMIACGKMRDKDDFQVILWD